MQDRLPLQNGKNNKLKITIPSSVYTLEGLIAYLSGGDALADVFANTDTGDNKGATSQGTPLIKGTLLSSEAAMQILGRDDETTTVSEALVALSDPKTIFLAAHPIGSIFSTVSSANPGTLYGGTWVAWGSGRVPVGVNPNDSNFNAVEKTGGSKDMIVPHHVHSVPSVQTGGRSASHAHAMNGRFWNNDNRGGSRAPTKMDDDVQNNYPWTSGEESNDHSHTVPAHDTNYAGTSGNATNANLQPYITCYLWKRTA